MKRMFTSALTIVMLLATYSAASAGGWDKSKGTDKVTIKGTLICVGCSLKKLSGANAQCSLYTHHAVGFKAEDGTIWNIIDNEKGHDIIMAHTLLEKNVPATITGWIYPIAHMIELDSIDVQGVSMSDIQKAAWEEDQMLAKELAGRKVGQAPTPVGHAH